MHLSLFRYFSLKSFRSFSTVFLCCGFALNLAGCDFRSLFSKKESGDAIMLNSFNYTSLDYIFIYYQDASEPSNILHSSFGGSAYIQEGSTMDLGSGVLVHSDQLICCFKWRKNPSPHIVLRVKWLTVYNRAHYQDANSRFDEPAIMGSLPGSQWCEAMVPLAEPHPSDPNLISVHFLPDGTLQAYAGKFGQESIIGPLKAAAVLAHSPRPGQPLCKTPIANPFYNIPRAPHRE